MTGEFIRRSLLERFIVSITMKNFQQLVKREWILGFLGIVLFQNHEFGESTFSPWWKFIAQVKDICFAPQFSNRYSTRRRCRSTAILVYAWPRYPVLPGIIPTYIGYRQSQKYAWTSTSGRTLGRWRTYLGTSLVAFQWEPQYLGRNNLFDLGSEWGRRMDW